MNCIKQRRSIKFYEGPSFIMIGAQGPGALESISCHLSPWHAHILQVSCSQTAFRTLLNFTDIIHFVK